MKHAIFIEPDGAVLRLVEEWKQRLRARWPHAVYLAHPPHATVWAGEISDATRTETALRQALKSATCEPVRLTGPHVFHDDVAARGGETLCFLAQRSDSLMALQNAVCAAIEPFVRSRYAFEGAVWMPHFTAASLPVRQDDPVIMEFRSASAAGLETPCRLGWWEINGERHERLAWL